MRRIIKFGKLKASSAAVDANGTSAEDDDKVKDILLVQVVDIGTTGKDSTQ